MSRWIILFYRSVSRINLVSLFFLYFFSFCFKLPVLFLRTVKFILVKHPMFLKRERGRVIDTRSRKRVLLIKKVSIKAALFIQMHKDKKWKRKLILNIKTYQIQIFKFTHSGVSCTLCVFGVCPGWYTAYHNIIHSTYMFWLWFILYL